MKITNETRKLGALALIIYILVLVWVIMLKCNMEVPVRMSLKFFHDMTVEQRAEWTFCHFRFNGDGGLLTKDAIEDIIVNIILFVPIGAFLPFVFRKRAYIFAPIYAFLITLGFELSQFIFGIGGFAYIDLITNTVGGIIGCGIFYLVTRKAKDDHIKNLLLAICCLLLCILGFGVVNTIINVDLYKVV